MKKILLAALAFGALVSCSKDEIISINQETIGFSNAFVDNTTRANAATDPSYGASAVALNQFNVWGAINTGDAYLPVFAGESVSGTVGASNVWNCEKTQYWVEDAVYNFAGLVNAGTGVTLGDNKLPAKVDFAVSTGKVDLLYAVSDTYTGLASNNPLVEMDFNHLLSKVMFTVNNTSTAATEYSFLVKNITINGATAGTCALPAMTWTSTAAQVGNFTEFRAIPVGGGVAKQVCESELLLIPGAVNVSFTIDIIYSGKTIATHNYATTAAQTLEVGHAYNFVINVSVGQPIQFTVESYPEWENDNTADSDDTDTEFDHIVLPVAEVTTGA